MTASERPTGAGGRFVLDGRPADAVAAPAESELADALASARGACAAVVPWGAGTDVETGNPLRTGIWWALSTERMAGVRELSPDDMVVTAGAGTTLGEVLQALLPFRQWLPIDPPGGERATLGGAFAAGVPGLRRAAHGSMADRVLGVVAALADGRRARSGARVVKSVAGYDLARLLSGSRGGLAVLTQITLRVSPLPQATATLAFAAASGEEAALAAQGLSMERLDPAWAAVATGTPAVLLVGVEGNADHVADRGARMGRVLREHGMEPVLEGAGEPPAWAPPADAVAAATLGCPRGETAAVVGRLEREVDGLLADPLAGRVLAWWQCGAQEGRITEAVRASASPAGHVTWTRLPPAWRLRIDAFEGEVADPALVAALKRALDPYGLLSPGRSIGRV
ncbi:MAG TPA: FAD-binding oxidoreductase [Chthonomonadales bacterium]|nr:FAD-binding oxidoreductase [Chthonomonadales bacterium]